MAWRNSLRPVPSGSCPRGALGKHTGKPRKRRRWARNRRSGTRRRFRGRLDSQILPGPRGGRGVSPLPRSEKFWDGLAAPVNRTIGGYGECPGSAGGVHWESPALLRPPAGTGLRMYESAATADPSTGTTRMSGCWGPAEGGREVEASICLALGLEGHWVSRKRALRGRWDGSLHSLRDGQQ